MKWLCVKKVGGSLHHTVKILIAFLLASWKAGRRYNRIAGAHEVSVSLAKRWFCASSGDKSSWKLVDLVS
ncbi:unnamed protein product, partial [Iphiclides podalirius]